MKKKIPKYGMIEYGIMASTVTLVFFELLITKELGFEPKFFFEISINFTRIDF
jgi:hypothetical protein